MKFPDTTSKPTTVDFNGITYRLMGGARLYYLSQSNTNEGRKGAKGLHVAIYEYAFKKKVPKGYDVHHVDHNPFNNSPDNLQCLTREEHRTTINGRWEKRGTNYLEHLNSIRHLAAAWHKSAAGRLWHAAHAKKKKSKNKPATCLQCGVAFLACHSNAKFCCHNCDMNWRQQNNKRFSASKVCVICNETFVTKTYAANKLHVGKTCSRACSVKLRSQTLQNRKKKVKNANGPG